MDLREHWEQIKVTFDASIQSSRHCAMATVGPDGYPHVTPIGFVFLRDDYSAFYFEEYTKRIPENIRHNPRVCLLLVNSGALFWLNALFRGRFAAPPGMRLRGIARERRLASDEELAAYRARVKRFHRTRGYERIWRDLRYVREIELESFEPVSYPKMTDHLWR